MIVLANTMIGELSNYYHEGLNYKGVEKVARKPRIGDTRKRFSVNACKCNTFCFSILVVSDILFFYFYLLLSGFAEPVWNRKSNLNKKRVNAVNLLSFFCLQF